MEALNPDRTPKESPMPNTEDEAAKVEALAAEMGAARQALDAWNQYGGNITHAQLMGQAQNCAISLDRMLAQVSTLSTRLAESEAREEAAVEKFAADVTAEAVRYARCYQPGTDGYNTFHLLADRIGALAALAQHGKG